MSWRKIIVMKMYSEANQDIIDSVDDAMDGVRLRRNSQIKMDTATTTSTATITNSTSTTITTAALLAYNLLFKLLPNNTTVMIYVHCV